MALRRDRRGLRGSATALPSRAVFDALESAGVAGPGMRLLEIGAGAGLATSELTRLVGDVVALEPGAHLSRALSERVPDVEVVTTMEELCAGGWLEPERTHRWRWPIELSAPEVRRLLTTFSNGSRAEADAAGRAVDDLGGVVTGHYQTVLHPLRRVAVEPRD